MPFYRFEDGSQTYIPDTKPETIAQAKENYRLSKQGQASVLGDIGRQSIRGLQKIGEGLGTTLATPIDLFFDTDLSRSIEKYYEKADVGEAKTTAGEVTRYLVQFGLPGFGVAGALSKFGKLNKFQSALGAGVADGAVATDDVVTLQDTFLSTDSESDEQRIARLNGSEAAYERLKKKMEVALEGGALVFGTPLALKGLGKVGGAALDTIAPAASYIAKTFKPNRKPGELQKTAFDADEQQTNTFFQLFKPENFRFFGESPDKLVGQTKYIRTGMVAAAQNQVDDTFNTIINVINKSVNSGSISQDTALRLARNVEDYMFPKIRVDFQQPNISPAAKKAEAERIQKEAFDAIKNLEQKYIDYKGVGLDYDNSISKLLSQNKDVIEDFSAKILDYSDRTSKDFMNLLLPDEFRDEIANNMGMYGTRLYKRFMDNAEINPEFKEDAVKEISNVLGLDPASAGRVFDELANPGPKNKVGSVIETPKLLEEGLKLEKGILKGRTLTDLPATRRALGEVAGYLSGDWQKALRNTQLVASQTAKKQANLVGKQEMFKNIKTLDALSGKTGGTKFLKTEAEALANGRQVDNNTIVSFDNKGNQITYRKFKAEDAGALDGMYATEKTYNALLGASTDIAANSDPIGKIYASMLGIKAAAQYGKTVLSGGAQVRNFSSIPFFSLLNGNLGSTGRFVDSVSTTFSGLLDPVSRTLKKDIIQELTEQGMIQKGGAQLGETLELARLASDNVDWVKGAFKVRDSVPVKFAEKAYGMTDNAGRVYNYLNEKVRFNNAIKKNLDGEIPIDSAKNILEFSDIIKGSSQTGAVIKPRDIINRYGEEALEKFIRNEAGEITANTVQNYQRIVPIVKDVIRKLPVGNFVAFPSEIIRNTYNALGRSIKELTSNNAEIQKIGMRRLTGAVATTSQLPSGVLALGHLLTGVDKEKTDAYKRSFAAPWDRTATLVPIASDKNGNPTQFFNFSYMNPYDYLKRPAVRLLQEIENGNRDQESLNKIALDAFGGSMYEMLQSFAEPAFSAQAILEATQGTTSTGKKIWNKGDQEGDRALKGFLHVVNTILPSATPFEVGFDPTSKQAFGLGIKTKNFPRAIIGSTNGKGEDKILDSRGREIDVAETLVQAFTGLKVIKPQLDRTLKYRAFEAQRAIKDTTNEFNSILRSSDPLTAKQILQGYINENEDRFMVLRDLYTAIEDARKLGLSESDIEKQLREGNVANYKEVMKGIFKPIEPSRELVQASRSGLFGDPQPVDQISLDLAGREMYQDLSGRFITPQERQQRINASQALRQEEEDKLLGN